MIASIESQCGAPWQSEAEFSLRLPGKRMKWRDGRVANLHFTAQKHNVSEMLHFSSPLEMTTLHLPFYSPDFYNHLSSAGSIWAWSLFPGFMRQKAGDTLFIHQSICFCTILIHNSAFLHSLNIFLLWWLCKTIDVKHSILIHNAFLILD